MAQLALYLFGPPRVEVDGVERYIRRRKAVALLAYLAVTQQPHSRDALATLFWPEYDQTNARTNLRRTLSSLHRALDRNWLEIDRATIRLCEDNEGWVDVWHFENALAGCGHDHGHDHNQLCPDCLPLLQQATELYHTGFMAGFTLADSPAFDDWQAYATNQLQFALATMLERLIEHYADQRHFELAIDYARRWVALDALHEPAQRRLMKLYALNNEQTAALRQYEECRQLLADELGVTPSPETDDLYKAIRTGEMRAATIDASVGLLGYAPTFPRHNFPIQTTTFIGREREMAALDRLLANPAVRLVTILAPGGMGKTRLAQATAERHLDDFANGVFFVPLASIDVASSIVTAIAETIGYSFYGEKSPAQQIMDFLQDRFILLVLDNFEHLLDGAPLVAEILRAAPGVRVLTTSRERLNLYGETVFSLGGLMFSEWETLAGSLNYDAVKFFLQSARRVRPDFELHSSDLDYLTRICRLTSGMPLGIELAAGWVDLLSLAQITAELQQGIDILETEVSDLPERHRSIRATFEHTWEHLSCEEQTIFKKLSIFRSGFTLTAAQTIAEASPRHLRRLSHKALIQTESKERFYIHELLRQFGASKLAETDELLALQLKHATFFAEFMAERKQEVKTSRQLEAMEQIELDFDNVRAAWLHLVHQQQWEQLSTFLHSLWFYCDVRARGHEAVELLEIASLALQATPSVTTELMLGRVLSLLGWFYNETGFADKGAATCDEAIHILRQIGTTDDLIAALFYRQNIAIELYQPDIVVQIAKEGFKLAQSTGDKYWEGFLVPWVGFQIESQAGYASTLPFAQQALAIFEESGNLWGIKHACSVLGEAYYYKQQFDLAKQWFRRGLIIAEMFNHPRSTAWLQGHLADIALIEEDYANARASLYESLKLYWNAGYQWFTPRPLLDVARLFADQDDCERAVEILAAIQPHLLAYGQTDQKAQLLIEKLKGKVEPDRFQSVWTRGQTLKLSTVVVRLLDEFESGI